MPELKFKFDRHGLGDVCHMAHAVQIYKRRGYDVTVQAEENKLFLWKVAGVNIIQGGDLPDHSYHYPSGFDDLSLPDHATNKVAFGLRHDVMPKLEDLGLTQEQAWDELCIIRLSAHDFISAEAHAEAEQFLDGLPHPIICFHSRGTNWHERKSLPTEVAFDVIVKLLDQTGGSVVVLDFDRRAPMVGDARCKGIKPAWGHISIEKLCALYEHSDLMIGVDSGPLHVASLTPIKTLGVFRSLHPPRVCLPNPNAVSLVSDRHASQWESRKYRWDCQAYKGSEPKVDDIVTAAVQILSGQHVAITATPVCESDAPAGRYLYRRVNHDERPMTLLPDGLISEGAGNCERHWKRIGGELQIHGDHGLIAALQEDERGVFVGRWMRFEKMAIELVPTWKPMSRRNGFVWHVDPTIERCDADLTDHEDWIYEYLHIPEGGLFVDVGAFVGQHSIRVAKSCKCRTIAIEPIPIHADVILKNATLNGVDDAITILRECAGNEHSTVQLHENGMSSRVERYGSLRAAIRPLRDILDAEQHIDLIKIDVEGMEIEVLNGLAPKSRAVDRILVEVHLYLSSALEAFTHEWAKLNGFVSDVIYREKNQNKFCYVLLTRRGTP
jgi:FkbM family methyltransferase